MLLYNVLETALDMAVSLSSGKLSPSAQSDLRATLVGMVPTIQAVEHGQELVSTPDLPMRRWVGAQSCSKVLGHRLGGPTADEVWDQFEANPRRLRAISLRVYQDLPNGVLKRDRRLVARWTIGERRLLDPTKPTRWWLLRAVARLLFGGAARDVLSVEDELRYCWTW